MQLYDGLFKNFKSYNAFMGMENCKGYVTINVSNSIKY